MTEFKRWWETYHQQWSLNQHYAQEGWKAALEWVNEMFKENIFCGGDHPVFNIPDEITQELND